MRPHFQSQQDAVRDALHCVPISHARTPAHAMFSHCVLQELVTQHHALKHLMQRDPERAKSCGTVLQLPFLLIQVGGGYQRREVAGGCCGAAEVHLL